MHLPEEKYISSPAGLDRTPQRGVATGTFVDTSGHYATKQTRIEAIGARHQVIVMDDETGKNIAVPVKQRIEHLDQAVVCIEYCPDWWIGTSNEGNGPLLLLLSAHQEVRASLGREEAAEWVEARDLIAGSHVLQLNSTDKPWATIVAASPVAPGAWNTAIVHELVLVEGDRFVISGDAIVRASTVAKKAEPKPKKLPLQGYPAIAYVPAAKSLGLAYAEVWYRKTVTLIPRCIPTVMGSIERLRAVLSLKTELRRVACAAMIDQRFKHEFIDFHQIESLEEILQRIHAAVPVAKGNNIDQLVDQAVSELCSPGRRRYSPWTGGHECHYVEAGQRWEFNEDGWIQVQ